MRKSKYTEEDYKKKCEELNLEYVGTHKKKHDGAVVEFICPKHRDKGVQYSTWSHFKNYTVGCVYCTGRRKTNEDIIPLIKNKDVELISEYKGNEKPINCRCKKCGNEWTTLPKTLITNGAGCPECGKEKASESRRKTTEQFILDLENVNPDIEVIGEYTGAHKKIKCRCRLDGTEWYGYPANLLNLSAGCPVCNLSGSERSMIDILKSFGLNIISQYSFDNCKHIHKLKFDAYDPDNNIAFEYNGEQHYYPIDFAGNGDEWAKNEFEKSQSRDKAKIKYCNDNNIPLVIIPYWDKDNMEEIIKSRLNELGVYKN